MKGKEVTLTRQHQLTIPKQICEVMRLQGGDRLEIIMSGHKLLLKPKKLIDVNDRAYRLGQEILKAERQVKRGETIPWAEVKRQHGL